MFEGKPDQPETRTPWGVCQPDFRFRRELARGHRQVGPTARVLWELSSCLIVIR